MILLTDITPINLSASQINPREARLSWSLPPDALMCGARFTVNIQGQSDLQVHEVRDSDMRIVVPLVPGFYSFNVMSTSGSESLVSEIEEFVINDGEASVSEQ